MLRSKTGKNQPGAAPEHLKWRFGILEPQNLFFQWDIANGTERGGGAAAFFFRGRREQKAAFPPCPDRYLKRATGARLSGFRFFPSKSGLVQGFKKINFCGGVLPPSATASPRVRFGAASGSRSGPCAAVAV